jgi:cytochrome c
MNIGHRFFVLPATILLLSACGSGADTNAANTTTSATVPAVLDGKAAFASCTICHNIAKGAGIKTGPNLYGVFGQKAGSARGYTYSSALKSSGIIWTETELDAYIANPSGKVPGTKMGGGAVSDAAKRKAIIAYLKQQTG